MWIDTLIRRHTCRRGCPATTLRNFSRPSRLVSITSSENLFVKTLPGNRGMLTLVDSRSRISRKASKSLYRRRTTECRSLKAGMLVYMEGYIVSTPKGQFMVSPIHKIETVMIIHLARDLIIRIHLTPITWRSGDGGGQTNPERAQKGAQSDGFLPCVCGFFTSISRKLSGTLYISSIYKMAKCGQWVNIQWSPW
jgi:hypothetical protein